MHCPAETHTAYPEQLVAAIKTTTTTGVAKGNRGLMTRSLEWHLRMSRSLSFSLPVALQNADFFTKCFGLLGCSKQVVKALGDTCLHKAELMVQMRPQTRRDALRLTAELAPCMRAGNMPVDASSKPITWLQPNWKPHGMKKSAEVQLHPAACKAAHVAGTVVCMSTPSDAVSTFKAGVTPHLDSCEQGRVDLFSAFHV